MKKHFHPYPVYILLIVFMFQVATPVLASVKQNNNLSFEHALQMLPNLTPEERVGQLFLVTFKGATAETDSQIYDLILNHHIGGVVLLAENDNFIDGDNAIQSAHNLIAQLQSYKWQLSQSLTADPITGAPSAGQYIPLFIGISQPGGGAPGDQIISALDPLPNLMAIGATWNTDYAEQVGQLAGNNLARIGFNLFFGPSLDVLESPAATLGNGLGAGVFGGDPFWVAQMGEAYTRGLHIGSNNKILVVARNFPGRGSSDRPVGEEPATVRKSLEYLKQIELAPFFAVTGDAPDALSTVDGLLVSHIRYQGFQGNIRATTRPVSFDSQALAQILSLPEFSTWSEDGGLLVSDDLGSETVRRFYDPGNTSFQARLVARDAFLAGNDILYLGNIQSTGMVDNYETVLNILAFFAQKYREDAAFAQQVDDAVTRILAAKYDLYGNFELDHVIPPVSGLDLIGDAEELTFRIAGQAATLVSPDLHDLETLLPEPPSSQDNIVIITDSRTVQQCTDCASVSMLGVDAMRNAILRLYGPQGGGQVYASHLYSYPLNSIIPILDGGLGNPDLESTIYQADWVILNMLDAEPGQEQTVVLRRFISERQDLLRNKYVIVFAFDAPYYLDSTDISKLTAYYCLYSKSAPFVEVAVRILFQEFTPRGALPVSVSGVGYDLFTALSPDPEQIINLALSLPSDPQPMSQQTPGTMTSTPTTAFRVGDSITVQTGILVDHNDHPVPDGTNVRFTLSLLGETNALQTVDSVTTQGIARAMLKIDTPGLFEIRATSYPAMVSVIIQVDVTDIVIDVNVLTPTSPSGPTIIPTPESTPVPSDVAQIERGIPGLAGWLLMVALSGGIFILVSFFGTKMISSTWGLRWGLLSMGGGMFGYTYLALRLPGAGEFIRQYQYGGISLIVSTCALVGWLTGFIWWILSRSRKAHRLKS